MAFQGTGSISLQLKDVVKGTNGAILSTNVVGTVKPKSLKFTVSSSPASTTGVYDEKTLGSGTLTVDLTAFASAFHATTDMTNAAMHTFIVRANALNTAAITIKPAASNGYNLFGTSSDQVTLPPGGYTLFHAPGAFGSANITSSNKDITITSSDQDAKFELIGVGG